MAQYLHLKDRFTWQAVGKEKWDADYQDLADKRRIFNRNHQKICVYSDILHPVLDFPDKLLEKLRDTLLPKRMSSIVRIRL